MSRRLILDGNSQSVNIDYQSELQRLTSLRAVNYSVGSQTTGMMITDAVTQIDPNFATNMPNVLVAAEVRNAIHGTALTARDGVDQLWAYFDARRAAAISAGVTLRLVVWNILPSGEGAPTNAKFDEANGYIAAEWASHADAFVDMRSDARLTDPANFDYFSTDMLHLSPAGARIQAGLIFSALQ